MQPKFNGKFYNYKTYRRIGESLCCLETSKDTLEDKNHEPQKKKK